MSSYIGPMADAAIKKFIDEFSKPENKEKLINNIMDPFIQDIKSRFYPYFIMLLFIVGLLIILIVLLIYDILGRKNC